MVCAVDDEVIVSLKLNDSSVISNPSIISVERGLAECRAGRPIAIRSGRSVAIAVSVEALDGPLARTIEPLARRTPRLVLPAPRLRRLGLDRDKPGVIAVPHLDLKRISNLSMQLGARFDAPVAAAAKLDEAALEWVRLSLVHPSVVVIPVPARSLAQLGLVEVDAVAIMNFRAARLAELKIVSRAPVPLEDATSTEFVVFRGGEGQRDHVAIIVGSPDMSDTVTVRLHSACLTGDLFGSLKCDCGDQLRQTIKYMSENGGGVLLYLDQEGRGNGLSNKIRAYSLQANGFDTYDADEVLGFGHDQRHFDFAASMLDQLGIKKVRIMTNNPLKIEALRQGGLDVVADQRIEGRQNDFNVSYLETKRDRAGHIISVETNDSADETGSD